MLLKDGTMEKIKSYVLQYFEVILILTVTLALVVTNYFIDQKMAFLNFYYLPVLISGYFLGRKQAMLIGTFVIGFVGWLIIFNGESFIEQSTQLNLLVNVVIWGGFLLLAAYIVGTLAIIITVIAIIVIL